MTEEEKELYYKINEIRTELYNMDEYEIFKTVSAWAQD